MSILCITLNPAIDMTVAVNDLQIGEVNRALSTQFDAAGKGLNAAQILSDLGFDAIASGFLGVDNASAFEQLFAQRKQTSDEISGIGQVQDAFVRVAGKTRTNIKLTDNGITTDINGKGFLVNADDKKQLFLRLTELAKDAEAVLLAGSLPQGFGADDFDELLKSLMAVNDKIAADVSGDALKVALLHRLWLVKPNDDELAEVFGKPADTLALQASLVASLPIDNVVVSMGDKGVHWFTDGKIYQSTPPKMTVKSTVGAGDTLTAGMMAALLRNLNPIETLSYATALSAHAVSIVGFKAASDDELNELLAKTSAKELSDFNTL